MQVPLNSSNLSKRNFHPDPETSRPFSCPNECGKAYRNTNGLSYHLKKSRCSKIRMQDSSLQEFLKRNMQPENESNQPQKKLKPFYDEDSISSLKSSVPAS